MSEDYIAKAERMLNSATGVVTPEVAAQRAQAYALIALVERVDHLINVLESTPNPATGIAEAVSPLVVPYG